MTSRPHIYLVNLRNWLTLRLFENWWAKSCIGFKSWSPAEPPNWEPGWSPSSDKQYPGLLKVHNFELIKDSYENSFHKRKEKLNIFPLNRWRGLNGHFVKIHVWGNDKLIRILKSSSIWKIYIHIFEVLSRDT